MSSIPRAGDFDADRIGIAVYRIAFEHAQRPIELFIPAEPTPVDLGPLLADARPGDIVQLGEGHYCGPARVPPGVVLRGLGPSRTRISLGSDPATSIVPDGPVLTIGRNARLEHVRVAGRTGRSDLFARPIVDIADDFVTVLGCVARRVRARDRRRCPRACGDRSGCGGRQRRPPPCVALPLHRQPMGRRCGVAGRRWPEHRVDRVRRTSLRGSTQRRRPGRPFAATRSRGAGGACTSTTANAPTSTATASARRCARSTSTVAPRRSSTATP